MNLEHQRQKVIYKPLSFDQTDHLLSINTIKPKFGIKKEYVTVVKNGFIIMDFVPFEKSMQGSPPSRSRFEPLI